jgi:5-deoxy-glucuronate isomerase
MGSQKSQSSTATARRRGSRPASETLIRSRSLPKGQSGPQLALTARRAGWEYVGFAVRQVASGDAWTGRTGGDEVCLVLLGGLASVGWTHDNPDGASHTGRATLGPRRDVFSDYPHALYLPPRTTFEVRARRASEFAECRSPTTTRFAPRVIRPADCGFEVRGGGNATRQIIDILPPSAEADRLLVCEVLTPAGNWSSYPPHKHDRHNPPIEADLEETYYYRFSEPGGYGIQRLYTSADREEQVLRVTHGDLVMVREGYHPFVAAPGVDAYYLNTLAGSFRSMAATDDPRYAYLRANWPPPDPRVPMIAKPSAPPA